MAAREAREGTEGRPGAATVIGSLAVLGAVGATVMFLAHLGLRVPVLEDLGPGRLLLPVAIGFAVGAVLYAVVAVGAFRVRSWAWLLGLVVNALALVSSVVPFRGVMSVPPLVVSAVAIAVLLSRPGRAAFGRA